MAKTGKWACFVAGIALLVALALPASASSDLPVTIDGGDYPGAVRLIDGRSYVALRAFAETVGGAAVRWDPVRREATAETDSLLLRAADGGHILEANGRALWCPGGIFSEDGTLWVPLRQTSEAFGFRCEYDEASRSVCLTREADAILPASRAYDADAFFWLSRIIEAEAGGEIFEGKLAVGTVICNRAASPDYPDTVRGVVFDTAFGVQFTPTANGTIRCTPSRDSELAAAACLEGYRMTADMLYFINEDLATSFWVPSCCRYITTVGNHDFYGD
ncbi:MAG: cell wall hydrolase [Clostridiales bacterium]|nr:cell wall hydrolase [Clostridiales bacterium]